MTIERLLGSSRAEFRSASGTARGRVVPGRRRWGSSRRLRVCRRRPGTAKLWTIDPSAGRNANSHLCAQHTILDSENLRSASPSRRSEGCVEFGSRRRRGSLNFSQAIRELIPTGALRPTPLLRIGVVKKLFFRERSLSILRVRSQQIASLFWVYGRRAKNRDLKLYPGLTASPGPTQSILRTTWDSPCDGA